MPTAPVWAIDHRAAQLSTPDFYKVSSDACLVLYTVELILMLYNSGGFASVKDWMTMMDAVIVICGWLEFIFDALNISEFEIGFRIKVTRVLRLVRIFRLIRLLKRIRTLKELHKLATMMATCMRTLLWCFLLCFFIMTAWAMLMVEVVNPIVQDMEQASSEVFAGCEFCVGATSTVMDANLLLFKTVIAGDSWGELAVPVIQKHPATAIIFVGSQLTLVFGVVNLIVAVVVDTFAEARENDVQNLAEEMEAEIQQDSKLLSKIFQRIDKGGTGELSLEDLIEGARSDPVFQSRLRVMDIDENDLQQLFQMIDVDQSGTIEVSEFIGPLSRWAHDSKTAPRFIKYNMLQTMHLQEDLYDLSVDCFNQLASRIDDLSFDMQLYKKGSALASDEDFPQHADLQTDEGQTIADKEGQDLQETKKHEELAPVDEAGSMSGSSSASGSVASADPNFTGIIDIDQPRATKDAQMLVPKTNMTSGVASVELIDVAMEKLEAKMDQFLKQMATIKPPKRKAYTPLIMSPRASEKNTQFSPRRRKPPRTDAFRSMYVDRHRSGTATASTTLKGRNSRGGSYDMFPDLNSQLTGRFNLGREDADDSRAISKGSRGIRSVTGSMGSWF